MLIYFKRVAWGTLLKYIDSRSNAVKDNLFRFDYSRRFLLSITRLNLTNNFLS